MTICAAEANDTVRFTDVPVAAAAAGAKNEEEELIPAFPAGLAIFGTVGVGLAVPKGILCIEWLIFDGVA